MIIFTAPETWPFGASLAVMVGLGIVEGAGLKIQLRSPMRPVVKLAFDGLCDDATITQLEAVLAWAIEQELPRGALGKCIEEAGGIGPILGGMAKAA